MHWWPDRATAHTTVGYPSSRPDFIPLTQHGHMQWPHTYVQLTKSAHPTLQRGGEDSSAMASGGTSAHDDADSSGVWSDLARDNLRPLLKLNDTLRTLSGLESDINVTTIVAVRLPLASTRSGAHPPGFVAKAAIPKPCTAVPRHLHRCSDRILPTTSIYATSIHTSAHPPDIDRCALQGTSSES